MSEFCTLGVGKHVAALLEVVLLFQWTRVVCFMSEGSHQATDPCHACLFLPVV